MNKDKKRKILVIDDDLSSCNMIAQTLEDKGFDVLFATNPEEGIDMARTIEPELIFINLLLPESNGLKVSKSIHSIENLKQVPVIMLISYAGELDPKYTATIGIVDVLVKPVNTDQIIKKTLNILGKDTALSQTEKPEQESSDNQEFESFTLSDEDEEEISNFTTSESELSADTIEPLTADEELIGQDDEHNIHELFDESSKQDSSQIFVSEDLGVKTEGNFDEEISGEKPSEKFSSLESYDEKATTKDIKQDGTNLDENIDYASLSESKKSSSRKIVLILASLLIIAGISFGVFLYMKSVTNESNKLESALLKETIQEPSPAKKEESKEAVPTASGGKSEEISVPVKEIDKPASAEKSKSLVKEPLPLKASKASAEKTKITYSVQAGIFISKKNAVSLVNKLKRKNYAAFIKKDSTAENKTLYRVLIGKFDIKKKALRLSKNILQKEGIKTTIHHN